MNEQSEPSEDADFGIQLHPATQDWIGKHLQAHYDSLVTAPIPDKFLVLLAMLEAKEAGEQQ